jgi:hypothetical protein
MKKRSLIVIPLLAVIILVVLILVIDSQRTPAWRVKINHYLTFLRETNHPAYHVESIASAAQPSNFSASMSAETYSDTPLFQTSSFSSSSVATELEPLPYPPEQVMCVLLHDGSQLQLVYVALHNNLYNADWVVHISPDPWGSQVIQFNLSSIGCLITELPVNGSSTHRSSPQSSFSSVVDIKYHFPCFSSYTHTFSRYAFPIGFLVLF